MTASGDTGPPANTTRRARARPVVQSGSTSSSAVVARPVQHDAERAVVAVFEHEHDGPVEVRIDERWRRDEQPAAQRQESVESRVVRHRAQFRAPDRRIAVRSLRAARRVPRRGRCGPRAHRSRCRRGLRRRLDRTLPGRDAGGRAAGRRRRGRGACVRICATRARRGRAAGRQHRPRRRIGAAARRDRPRPAAARRARSGRRRARRRSPRAPA